MKKLIQIILICAFAALSAGCKKYLDKGPIGIFTEDEVLADPTIGTISGSVENSYHLLSSTLNILGEWDWARGLVLRNDFLIQDVASGDANKKWNPDGDQPWMDEVSSFNFTPENPAFNGVWSYNYDGISRVNQPIAQLTDDAVVQKIGMSEAQRNQLLGEAYFLRAFYYFDLVVNFGDVPVVLTPLKQFSDAYKVAFRVSADSVWKVINSDLSNAVSLLPNSKYSDNTERWRASKGAAIAMQAKAALYTKNWAEVIKKVGELETLNYYQLNSNYFDSFDITKEFTDNEVIFAYNHRPAVLPRRGNGLTALLGWGFVAPTSNFINEFEANDPRLAYTVNVADQAVYKILGNTSTANKGNDDAPSNKVFIRWADVLLWKAEALMETNDLKGAVTIINQIRQRARTTPTVNGTTPPPGTLPDRDVNTTNKELVREWLMHERRVELGMESHRFNDLRRWRTAKQVLTAMGKNFTDRNYLYPIPQGERDKSGGTITQNDY